jgi:heterodisulfide reductase subunit B
MKYGYYPGCSLHSTGAEYDVSFRAVAEKLGIELDEVPGWVCCGTSPAHASSHLLAVALPVKNLALAEKAGKNEVVVPCAACFSRFKIALYETHQNPGLLQEVKEVIDSPFVGKIKVLHPLDIMEKNNEDKIKDAVVKDISRIKVACYYGCLLTRPHKAMAFSIGTENGSQGDDPEYPMAMDRTLEKCGATVLDWSYKTDCCGATFSLTETNAVLRLCNKILENARAVGANVIAVACPLCHANLDTRQVEIEAEFKTRYGIPILYFTQVMGLAFGIEPENLALKKHLVSPEPVLENILKA